MSVAFAVVSVKWSFLSALRSGLAHWDPAFPYLFQQLQPGGCILWRRNFYEDCALIAIPLIMLIVGGVYFVRLMKWASTGVVSKPGLSDFPSQPAIRRVVRPSASRNGTHLCDFKH